jgi:hypothetical protein
LEIYTIDSVESLISNTDLVSDLKGEMKLKTIEKHHYVIHLIIRSNLIRNSFETYINIPSKQLKGVLGRDYISIIKNLEGLNIIDVNSKYSAGKYSKSYKLGKDFSKQKNQILSLKSRHMIKSLEKQIQSIKDEIIRENELLSKIDKHTQNLFLIDEVTKFQPPRDFVLTKRLEFPKNTKYYIDFGKYVDNPNRLFRYEQFRRGLLELNKKDISSHSLSIFYSPTIASSGRIYHMVTSIPRKIRAGLRTKNMELIYEVDMASAQPSILILEWLKHLTKHNSKISTEASKCLNLVINGGIYEYIKTNSKYYKGLDYTELKKAVLTSLNRKDYKSQERDELIKLFPEFMKWVRRIKSKYDNKKLSFIGQSAEAAIFIGVFKELDSNIFALPIHDCIISTKKNIPLIKEMLISKTKNIYSIVLSESTDLDKLFKTSLVSIDNSNISNKNWVKYIMDEGEDRDNYIEEYGVDYPYEPLGSNDD